MSASRFKLDYDEGTWLLNIDCGCDDITLRLDDMEAFELNGLLAAGLNARKSHARLTLEQRDELYQRKPLYRVHTPND